MIPIDRGGGDISSLRIEVEGAKRASISHFHTNIFGPKSTGWMSFSLRLSLLGGSVTLRCGRRYPFSNSARE
jgi:hypothetical protein